VATGNNVPLHEAYIVDYYHLHVLHQDTAVLYNGPVVSNCSIEVGLQSRVHGQPVIALNEDTNLYVLLVEIETVVDMPYLLRSPFDTVVNNTLHVLDSVAITHVECNSESPTCTQRFRMTMIPLEQEPCLIDDAIELSFQVGCVSFYSGACPIQTYERIATVTTTLTSSYLCPVLFRPHVLTIANPVLAALESDHIRSSDIEAGVLLSNDTFQVLLAVNPTSYNSFIKLIEITEVTIDLLNQSSPTYSLFNCCVYNVVHSSTSFGGVIMNIFLNNSALQIEPNNTHQAQITISLAIEFVDSIHALPVSFNQSTIASVTLVNNQTNGEVGTNTAKLRYEADADVVILSITIASATATMAFFLLFYSLKRIVYTNYE
jgi:hypothetical protein